MNLGFLQMTIKTLEMQKAALQAIHDSAKAAGGRGGPAGG
jgi:hypothetical protein